MRRVQAAAALAITCGVGALGPGGALASTAPPLILRAAGALAPVGTPAAGVLQFGPCGTLKSSGTLTINERPTDRAALPTVEQQGGGGCGEGGPNASGQISRIVLTSAGHLTVVGELTYTTSLPNRCVYKLTRMTGRFKIPGSTQAAVSGMGLRGAGSDPGCTEKVRVGGGQATLDERSSGEPFEAEI
jgi:hypothetical protein